MKSKAAFIVVCILIAICGILGLIIGDYLNKQNATDLDSNREVVVLDKPADPNPIRTTCPMCGHNYIFDTTRLGDYEGYTFPCTRCSAVLKIGESGIMVVGFQ